MTVVVDELFGVRHVRTSEPRSGQWRRNERRRVPARRRPPQGARVAPALVRRPRACVLERPRMGLRSMALASLTVFAVVAFSGLVIGRMVDGMAPAVPERTATVQVADESLWEVASVYAPESDPRAVVQRIEEINGVDAAAVPSGSALVVPVAR